MPLVVLQPSASSESLQHFEDTIESPVSLELYSSQIADADLVELKLAHPSGFACLWGAKPGESGQHVPKWERIAPGDYILFAGNGRLFASAVVTWPFRNAIVARELWGEASTRNGVMQTWELMFAIEDIEVLDVPYAAMNEIIGRKPNAVVQEFNVLPQNKSEELLDYLNRVDNRYQKFPSQNDYESIVLAEDFGDLERRVMRAQRLEQRFLRNAIMPGLDADCALCGRAFPVDFLSAAHIKRRSICTDEEKRRFADIAMPNCRFGCDELFGRGLVAVDETGEIRLSDLLEDGAARDYAQEHLFGRKCVAWQRPGSREFFQFHYEIDFRRPAITDDMTP
jgi:hypothetical protein